MFKYRRFLAKSLLFLSVFLNDCVTWRILHGLSLQFVQNISEQMLIELPGRFLSNLKGFLSSLRYFKTEKMIIQSTESQKIVLKSN